MNVKQKIERLHRLALVVLLFFGMFIPLLTQQKASAYALPSLRFVKMSSSANAESDVTYQVSFTTNQGSASSNIGGLVLEFCSDTPIIGDTCTPPTGFNAHAFTGDNTLAIANQVGITDWTKSTTNATINRLILTRTATSVATAITVTFDMGFTGAADGVGNPSTTNTTFFARVLTFATTAGATGYVTNNVEAGGTAVDAGGMAMSTAAQITVTAKVPEKLTFCVYTSASSNNCTAVSGTAVTLGDNNGVLSDLEEFVNDDAKYTISTNALSGVAIRIKGGTLKSSLSCSEAINQNCSINAIGGTKTTNAAGSEQFGFCTYQTAGSGLTPASPYDDTECDATNVIANSGVAGNNIPNDAAVTNGVPDPEFAFDNNNTTGTTSTYGMTFANKIAGAFSTGKIAFLGNISPTTEPGIYTTTLTFIATGTY